ncbi:MAG: zf-HC2 domain-containing protein [Pyrinomonadaceae bacterium]|nr:zf-HC2 domain-containing protein [Pyrinomonadaceae bacterium]
MPRSLTAKLKWQLILALARRLPDCKTITPKLGESVDRRLSYRDRVINRLHLFTCEACRRYLSQIRFLHTALAVAAKDPETFPTAELSSDAKERIKKVISSSIGNVF